MTRAAAPASRRIRVTLYSDAVYYGGAEQYLAALARHLDESRFVLSALVEIAPGADRLAQELAAAGARVERAERPGFGWWKRVPDLIRMLRALPGDLLHLNLPSSYDAGVSSLAWAAKRAGYAAVVTTEHLPMIDRKYKKFPVKFFFSHWVDRAIAIAEANRALLVHRHGLDPQKVVAVPNGVDRPPVLGPGRVEALRAEWGAGDRAVIGSVGRLTARKGQHHLIAALAMLPREECPLLVLVGEGEEEGRLRRQAADQGVGVVFTGARSDAASLPQAFDLFVLASSIETMPLTVLEAMAGGAPVLATDIYGLPEMVEDGVTGRLVPPGDAHALSAAIRTLLAAPETLSAMGTAGRRRYEELFTSQGMAERTARVYLEALAHAGHGVDRHAA